MTPHEIGCAPRILIVVAAAGLIAGALAMAGPAPAEATAHEAVTHSGPLRPPPALQADPKSEVQELLRQISELDDQWDGLTPAQRNQRIAGLQQQVTVVQNDVNNLPPEQKPEVQGMLGVAILRLADILRKERFPTG
jgi:hypothetical protein